MKTILIVLASLLAHTLAGEEAIRDPFAEGAEEPVGWPKRLAPSEKHLKRFHEPVLKGIAPVDAGDIRFIWVPTFNKPISIRATKIGDKVILRVVRMSGKGGYDWENIEVQKELPLTQQQWTDIVTLASVDGAREPSQKAEKELREHFVEAMSGLDGSTWYLEVRDRNGYTVEGVPNPLVGDEQEVKRIKGTTNLDFRPFLAVCLKLFELSGLDERPNY
jgi:hypothetical protein